MQRFLESGTACLALLPLPLALPGNKQISGAPGNRAGLRRAISLRDRVSQRAQEQLRQAQICPGMVWIDQQALLIIGRYLGEFRFGFLEAIRTLKRTRFLVEHLSQ